MPEFNIPPRRDGIYIQMPKADLEMVLAMLRHPANADKQGKGALFSEEHGGYCCLGAMQCAKTGGFVQLKRGAPSLSWLLEQGWYFYGKDTPPSSNPYLPMFGASAITANDKLGKTFSEIADAIEACAEGY